MIALMVFVLCMCCRGCGFGGDGEEGRSERCQELDAWFDENPYDSNETLNKEYVLC